MPVFSFLKRNQNETPALAIDEAATVWSARSRARHRLIGAVVLVVVGLVTFPLLFDTQPRPVAVDIPIEGPAKRGTAAAPAPAANSTPVAKSTPPQPASVSPPAAPTASAAAAGSAAAPASARAARAPVEVITEKAVDVAPPVPGPASAPVATAAARPASAVAPGRPATAASKPVPAPAAAKPERSADAERAQALLDGTAPALPAAAPDSPAPQPAARFVVQAGAYTDDAALRDARQKVERLGLKTYTQVVQTGTGPRTRLRVGPFATREEAEQAAQRIKASGLAVNTLSL